MVVGLKFEHLKIKLANAAFWARPVVWNVFPFGARCDAFFWAAKLFVVYPAADNTFISFYK